MTDTHVEAPRRRVSMPFDKPEEGWTARAGLSTGPVTFHDSTDPEYFADEMQAVFRRNWLYMGRAHQVADPGDYFTREIPGLGDSLIISRGRDGKVRAFHNMCTHRGNKLVWEDHPMKETCGNARRFSCKYHNWQFDPEGQLRLVNKEDWFTEPIDKSEFGLVEVACDVWADFVFVNLDPNPKQTLLEAVGPFVEGLEGYPFEPLTQCYTFHVDAKANWKIFLDAMVEQYHGNTLHYKLVDQDAKGPLRGAIGSHFEIFDRNSIWSVAVPAGSLDADTKTRETRLMEGVLQANLWGQEDGPRLPAFEKPPLLNLTDNPGWSNDMFHIFPNFDMLVWKREWILIYSSWPIAVDEVRFEARMYFQPPRNATDRMAQELVGVEFKEFLLQDANLLECAQQMLNKNLRDKFVLSDEEVLVRNNHRTSREAVEAYRAEQAANGPS
ncbi:MAG: aromatic ring-hydroxylating dioxygenase subunit alpha [Actinomycetota bacterium]|nr:aromatic ring-hydroxylating dioxygenase subunit alpha [Actinomycetota bacterium]